MLDFFAERSREDAPALIRPGGEAMSYGGLAMAVAAVMQALGTRVGEVARRVVGIAVDDAAGYVASVLAVLEAGGVALPLDLRRGWPALQAEAERARVIAVVVGNAAEDALDVVAGDPARREVGVASALALEAGGRRAVHGLPGLYAGIDAIVDALGLSAATRLPIVGAMTHHAVLVGQILATLRAGGTLLDVARLDDDARAAAVARLGATAIAAAPSAVRALARRSAGLGVTALSSLGAVDAETAALFARAFPSARRTVAWATPEALRVAEAAPDAPFAPLPGVRVAADEAGALSVASAWTMLGYLDDAEATRAAVTVRDGARWVRTGERGRVDERGVTRAGRDDAAVEVHGERVDPAALERTLVTTPGVREAAVLALPDAEAGARLYAFYAGDAAAAPQHPARLVQLESLPHRPDGAIDREALRRMATAD